MCSAHNVYIVVYFATLWITGKVLQSFTWNKINTLGQAILFVVLFWWSHIASFLGLPLGSLF